MAYLHCHTKGCHWQQDDFWDKSYNPISSLQHWENDLLSPKREKQFTVDSEFLRENGPISTREVIAREFERKARVIRNMFCPTYDEWKKIRETAVCPKCGQRNWDID